LNKSHRPVIKCKVTEAQEQEEMVVQLKWLMAGD